MTPLSRFRGCLLGLAVGDAIGTTVEFQSRGAFEPLTDMVGGGVFKLRAGQWTDDTSMALCLATSLIERDGFDALDQMERYCRWRETGYLSSTGTCFDIGGATAAALARFRRTGDPYAGSSDPRSSGNGSLMRLAPIPMFYFSDLDAVGRYAAESSRTTHGAAECVDASRLFARVIWRALHGRGDYREKSETAIRGSGYVVESLEAALWCFSRSDSFESAVLMAANLGDDADTTAAVCGQLAGAYYGESGIPQGWRERLALRSEITRLADRLCEKTG